MTQTTHPSKHVVRAYLERRSHEVKPPPTPEEIRRQLGWHCSADKSEHFSTSTLFLPGTIAQLATLMAMEWCFLAAGISRPN